MSKVINIDNGMQGFDERFRQEVKRGRKGKTYNTDVEKFLRQTFRFFRKNLNVENTVSTSTAPRKIYTEKLYPERVERYFKIYRKVVIEGNGFKGSKYLREHDMPWESFRGSIALMARFYPADFDRARYQTDPSDE